MKAKARWCISKVFVAAALLAIASAVLLSIKQVTPVRAGVAVGILLLAVTLLFARKTNIEWATSHIGEIRLKAGGTELALGLVTASSLAVARIGRKDEEDETVEPDLIEMRFKLEHKLAYIAKHILADNYACWPQPVLKGWDHDPKSHPTFLTIGSLKYDHYLTEEEALTAWNIQTLSSFDVKRLPDEFLSEFLSNAAKLVRNIRAIVFRSQVSNALDEIKKCEPIGDLRLRGGMLTLCANYRDKTIIVVPILDVPGGRAPDSVAFPWKKHQDALVVVPNCSRTKPGASGVDERIVRVGNLEEGLVAASDRLGGRCDNE